MKLYLDKTKCRIEESINGRVWEIDTEDVIYIEDGSKKLLLHPDSSEFYSAQAEGPFITSAPKDYTL